MKLENTDVKKRKISGLVKIDIGGVLCQAELPLLDG